MFFVPSNIIKTGKEVNVNISGFSAKFILYKIFKLIFKIGIKV